MGKIYLAIAVLYIVYYSGNIIYDLFIKKDKNSNNEATSEVFLIGEDDIMDDVKNVVIDDIESIKTPEVFENKELGKISNTNFEKPDTELWRKRFEDEQNIDAYMENENKQEKVNDISKSSNEETKSLKKRNIEWKDMMNLAETQVRVINSIDGYKIYKAQL